MGSAAEKVEQSPDARRAAGAGGTPRFPAPTPQLRLPDVPLDRLPRSIAIIMDGNGRWAVERGLPRMHGHKTGAQSVRSVVTECAHLGIEALTLYSFSIENWKRPEDEVDFLMSLYEVYLIAERQEMIDNNIRFIQCGRRSGLPGRVLEELDRTIEATRHCSGLKLVLAINYGSRAEITDAVKAIASKVQAGVLRADDINEETIRSHLYVPELPDPDLLIRTAGEMRISNYLLWQISYAELYVTKTLWPDFGVEGLRAAIRDYASRHRRFGGIDHSNS
ncbi:MAG: isoprenyl transferase [Phycisphaerales bacterium]|nr:isoprenyl transferase [Phycisphaerales bacterium]